MIKVSQDFSVFLCQTLFPVLGGFFAPFVRMLLVKSIFKCLLLLSFLCVSILHPFFNLMLEIIKS